MKRFWRFLGAALLVALASTLTTSDWLAQGDERDDRPPNAALINGQWFDGSSFEARTVYSVEGRLTSKKPARVDRSLDLSGTWVIPPFGEAHNHNIGGVGELDGEMIRRYLADGVFYVKIQGNLPLSQQTRHDLALNRPSGVDVVFSQGSLTASGGHPIALLNKTASR